MASIPASPPPGRGKRDSIGLRFPTTRGSYACYLPGQWTALRGAEGEPAGNLHFAGEHCSLAAQGFMEGGCETGERAAAEVMAALGYPAKAALGARPRVALPT
jgi:monoamine oxidase